MHAHVEHAGKERLSLRTLRNSPWPIILLSMACTSRVMVLHPVFWPHFRDSHGCVESLRTFAPRARDPHIALPRILPSGAPLLSLLLLLASPRPPRLTCFYSSLSLGIIGALRTLDPSALAATCGYMPRHAMPSSSQPHSLIHHTPSRRQTAPRPPPCWRPQIPPATTT
jgi:hypothetical protein